MAMRLIVIVVIAIALIGILGNFSSQGNMLSTFQNFQASITTIAYAGELNEIKTAVDEFLVLRTISGTEDGKLLAEKIDKRINKLELVKKNCNQEISTLDLAYEKNPYEKLRQMCPALENLSTSKAIQLFRLI